MEAPESAAQGMREARQQRQAIISALYQQRRLHPAQPGITLGELEQTLKMSKAELEFSLWYLTEGLYVKRTDNGTHSITLKGVDLAENMIEHLPV
jgi:DNA-binding IclR family transcriptional regulator